MQAPGTPAAQPAGLAPPPPPVVRESRWLSTLAVLAVILFASLGGFLLAGEPTAAGQRIRGEQGTPGPPIPVGPITIRPAAGWTVAEQVPEPPQLRLTNGSAQLFVVIPSVQASADGHLQSYVEEVLNPQAGQLSISPVRPVELPSGQPASLISYTGSFQGVATRLEGEVLALVSSSGTPAVFDGWAAEGLWRGSRAEVRTMISTAEIP